MTVRIAIDRTEHGTAAALWDGGLLDLLIDAPENNATPLPGAIYAARVDRPIKGIGGAMVALSDGQTGFLRDARGLAPGTRVLVQVSTFAEPGKSAPVTRRLLFKSRYVIVTPDAPGLNVARAIRSEDLRDDLRDLANSSSDNSTYGMILRSRCATADKSDVAADISQTHRLAEQVVNDPTLAPALLLDADSAEALAWRDWPHDAEVDTEPGAFERLDIWGEIEKLKQTRHDLPGGAWMSIEPTRALLTVDVNTGGDTSLAACLKANRNAARDLPRALRLRGLGGQIIVDFAPMNKKDRREVELTLRAALKNDAIETYLAGWSNLGLAEMVRKRERRPISEVL